MHRLVAVLLVVPLLALGCSDDDEPAEAVPTTVAGPMDPVVYESAVTEMCKLLADGDEDERSRAIGLFRSLVPPLEAQERIERDVQPLIDRVEAADGDEERADALDALRNTMGSLGHGGCADALAQ